MQREFGPNQTRRGAGDSPQISRCRLGHHRNQFLRQHAGRSRRVWPWRQGPRGQPSRCGACENGSRRVFHASKTSFRRGLHGAHNKGHQRHGLQWSGNAGRNSSDQAENSACAHGAGDFQRVIWLARGSTGGGQLRFLVLLHQGGTGSGHRECRAYRTLRVDPRKRTQARRKSPVQQGSRAGVG